MKCMYWLVDNVAVYQYQLLKVPISILDYCLFYCVYVCVCICIRPSFLHILSHLFMDTREHCNNGSINHGHRIQCCINYEPPYCYIVFISSLEERRTSYFSNSLHKKNLLYKPSSKSVILHQKHSIYLVSTQFYLNQLY